MSLLWQWLVIVIRRSALISSLPSSSHDIIHDSAGRVEADSETRNTVKWATRHHSSGSDRHGFCSDLFKLRKKQKVISAAGLGGGDWENGRDNNPHPRPNWSTFSRVAVFFDNKALKNYWKIEHQFICALRSYVQENRSSKGRICL